MRTYTIGLQRIRPQPKNKTSVFNFSFSDLGAEWPDKTTNGINGLI